MGLLQPLRSDPPSHLLAPHEGAFPNPIVLSFASIVAAGGFCLGLILAVVGGILGIVFKHAPEAAQYPGPVSPPA